MKTNESIVERGNVIRMSDITNVTANGFTIADRGFSLAGVSTDDRWNTITTGMNLVNQGTAFTSGIKSDYSIAQDARSVPDRYVLTTIKSIQGAKYVMDVDLYINKDKSWAAHNSAAYSTVNKVTPFLNPLETAVKSKIQNEYRDYALTGLTTESNIPVSEQMLKDQDQSLPRAEIINRAYYDTKHRYIPSLDTKNITQQNIAIGEYKDLIKKGSVTEDKVSTAKMFLQYPHLMAKDEQNTTLLQKHYQDSPQEVVPLMYELSTNKEAMNYFYRDNPDLYQFINDRSNDYINNYNQFNKTGGINK